MSSSAPKIPESAPNPATLPDDIEACHALIRALAEDNERLHARLDYLLRRLFGPRSERLDPNQLLLLDTPEEHAPISEAPAEEAVSPPRPRKGHGRRPLPEDLPRKQIIHDVPPEQKVCPACHAQKTRFGEEVSEQLEYIPASLYVIEHVRLKYACTQCAEHVSVAAKPPQPIDKGLAGPGLLAHVITSKYCDHLPLHRQEQIFARHGVQISRKTQSGWMLQCGELMKPLVERMAERVRCSHVIHTDDTPVPVQVPGKKRRSHRAFLWTYVGDEEHPYVVYDFTWTRSREGPESFLRHHDEKQRYRGYLQADAYPGYSRLYATGDILEVGCWAHARRKFYDARDTNPIVAHQTLERIKNLYAVEALGREVDAHARCALRKKEAQPELDAFKEWALETRLTVLPKSPIGHAFDYALGNWTALTRYVEDGRLAIDNNTAERAIRPLVLGRKNWLFAGSKQGGYAAAILYSLIESARRNGLDPFAYLRDILTRMPTIPKRQLDELLPDKWANSIENAND